jgi:methionyl-tRNA formyltransferase
MSRPVFAILEGVHWTPDFQALLSALRNTGALAYWRYRDHEYLLDAPDDTILVSAGYKKKIPASILQRFARRWNMHAGALPDLAGSCPTFWARFKGHDKLTVTINRLEEGLDAGGVLAAREIAIDDSWTGDSIWRAGHQEMIRLFAEQWQRMADPYTTIGESRPPLAYHTNADLKAACDRTADAAVIRRLLALSHPDYPFQAYFMGHDGKKVHVQLHTRRGM